MAHLISWFLSIKVLHFLCLFQSAKGQSINPDEIDFTITPGWTNLRSCVRDCFECEFCDGPDSQVGCLTNQCMCRPSALFTGVQFVVDCARRKCETYDDMQQANDTLVAYCNLKGYTTLPTIASATNDAGVAGGYYTRTVFQPTTVYISRATKRVEAVFAAVPRISTVKPTEIDIGYIFETAKLVMILLASTFFLFSVAVGLRA